MDRLKKTEEKVGKKNMRGEAKRKAEQQDELKEAEKGSRGDEKKNEGEIMVKRGEIGEIDKITGRREKSGEREGPRTRRGKKKEEKKRGKLAEERRDRSSIERGERMERRNQKEINTNSRKNVKKEKIEWNRKKKHIQRG